jgi:hypothetical protein
MVLGLFTSPKPELWQVNWVLGRFAITDRSVVSCRSKHEAVDDELDSDSRPVFGQVEAAPRSCPRLSIALADEQPCMTDQGQRQVPVELKDIADW